MIVEEEIIQNHIKTDGKCGLSLPKLCSLTGLEMKQLKSELNKLWKEGKIEIREGINGKLIFKK